MGIVRIRPCIHLRRDGADHPCHAGQNIEGHTGRKVVFDALDKLVLWIMMLAFVFRIIAPQVYPVGYTYWIYLAHRAGLPVSRYSAWRYIPFLVQPRIDGKEH